MDAQHEYWRVGESAWRAFDAALGASQTLFKRAKPGRVLLLTFPNAGTTATLLLADCLASQASGMCTEYCSEVKVGNATHPADQLVGCPVRPPPLSAGGGTCHCSTSRGAAPLPCGPGAVHLRMGDGPARAPQYSVLVKTHGVEFAWQHHALRFKMDRADALVPFLTDRFGRCDGAAPTMSGVLRVVRNPFDHLGARFHYEQKMKRIRHNESFASFAVRARR